MPRATQGKKRNALQVSRLSPIGYPLPFSGFLIPILGEAGGGTGLRRCLARR
jgi:hypothetical protein